MSICPRCGERFECGVEEGKSRCWCFDLERITPPGTYADGGCLCGNCLRAVQHPSHEELYRRIRNDR